MNREREEKDKQEGGRRCDIYIYILRTYVRCGIVDACASVYSSVGKSVA